MFILLVALNSLIIAAAFSLLLNYVATDIQANAEMRKRIYPQQSRKIPAHYWKQNINQTQNNKV